MSDLARITTLQQLNDAIVAARKRGDRDETKRLQAKVEALLSEVINTPEQVPATLPAVPTATLSDEAPDDAELSLEADEVDVPPEPIAFDEPDSPDVVNQEVDASEIAPASEMMSQMDAMLSRFEAIVGRFEAAIGRFERAMGASQTADLPVTTPQGKSKEASSPINPTKAPAAKKVDVNEVFRELNEVNVEIVKARKAGNHQALRMLQERAQSLMALGNVMNSARRKRDKPSA